MGEGHVRGGGGEEKGNCVNVKFDNSNVREWVGVGASGWAEGQEEYIFMNPRAEMKSKLKNCNILKINY